MVRLEEIANAVSVLVPSGCVVAAYDLLDDGKYVGAIVELGLAAVFVPLIVAAYKRVCDEERSCR